MVGALLIAVVVGLGAPIAASRAGFSAPSNQPSATANVSAASTGFNFQGRLEVDGVPADGTYDFEFRLFDLETGGTQLPTTLATVAQSLVVSNGLFSTLLYFGTDVYDGKARWIEVRAREGVAEFVTLPRQQLAPTPYAMFALKTTYAPASTVAGTEDIAARSDHTHFAQQWVGDLPGVAVLSMTNDNDAGIGLVAQGGGATGFLGYQGHIGLIGGVGGGTCSTVGTANIVAGVFGSTCFNTTNSYGVRGYGLLGAGVYGEGGKTGVLGESFTSSSTDGIGVLGAAGAAPPVRPDNTGVYGYGFGIYSTGVYGRADGFDAVAVKGVAPTSDQFAGLFQGEGLSERYPSDTLGRSHEEGSRPAGIWAGGGNGAGADVVPHDR